MELNGKAVVQIQGVCHHYRNGDTLLNVLQEIDLSLSQGEFIAIMGASGSGKSTLLHILGCLQKPSAGSYVLNGEEITSLPEKRLAEIRSKKIGQIFQLFHLLPQMDVGQNVALPFLYSKKASIDIRDRVVRAIDLVGLGDRISHKPSELSGGEMQRVAIARALAQNPDLILADEPTGNLDEENSSSVLELFQMMNQAGHSVIMVTHDTRVASFAQKIYMLKNGSIYPA